MMRFLILSQYFPPEVGAPQVRLAAMAAEMIRQGHEVEVVTSMPNHPTGSISKDYRGRLYICEKWRGIKVHRVWLYAATGAGLRRMLNYASFMLASVIGIIRSKRPDVIFVESPPLFLSIPAFIAAKLWGASMIFNVADLWPDSVYELGLIKDGVLLRLARAIEGWSYRKAAFVNAVTEGIRCNLIRDKHVPEEKVLFLPNGVDIGMFTPSDHDESILRDLGLGGKKIILYAGTLGIAQGLEVALDAIRALRDILPQAHLVFIGSGSEKEKLVRISRKKAIKNVTFLDPGTLEYVSSLYSASCVGLVTLKSLPLFEGARPSKMFPIMASGRPVVYSGSGEGAELIRRADAGIIAEPENSEALANAIQVLVDNPDKAENLGRNGRKYVEKHLVWQVLIDNWFNQMTRKGCMLSSSGS